MPKTTSFTQLNGNDNHHVSIPDENDPINYHQAHEKPFSEPSFYEGLLTPTQGTTFLRTPLKIKLDRCIVIAINDFNCLHCSARTFASKSKRAFHVHMLSIHKTDLISQQTEKETMISPHPTTKEAILPQAVAETISSSLSSDINDPDLFCNACGSRFAEQKIYHHHLQSYHKMLVDLIPLSP